MRVSKPLVYANLTALSLNGVMLCLMAVKAFPPLLGIVLIIVFLVCSVALSCYLNGQYRSANTASRFTRHRRKKVMRSW